MAIERLLIARKHSRSILQSKNRIWRECNGYEKAGKPKQLAAAANKKQCAIPTIVHALSVGRAKSLAAVEASLKTEGNEILIFTQRDSATETPVQDDLFTMDAGL